MYGLGAPYRRICCSSYYTLKVESLTYEETEKHIKALSYRMEDVGEEAF